MERTVFASDHELFRAAFARTVDEYLTPSLPQYRQDGALDRAAFQQVAASGVLGLAVPEQYGGAGTTDYRFHAVAIEELARVSHGLSSTLTIHFDIATPYIVEFAGPVIAERWLPQLAAGQAIAAFALTEPSGGSDAAALATRALALDDGWLLTGTKSFITNAAIADVAVVAARTGADGPRGISLFAVDTSLPGVVAGPTLRKLGLHESNTADLSFDGVRLDHSALLGEVDAGFGYLMARLPQERLSSAVANVAQTRSVFAHAVDHARSRRAFGTALGSLQHNKFLLADLSARIESVSAFVDACINAQVERHLTAADAARAKLLSARVEHDVLDAAVQLAGGAGLMADSPIGQAWTDGRVTRIWAGADEIMREIIGRDLDL